MTYRRSDDPLYKTWYQFKRSTEDPTSSNYHAYGGFGIKLYKPWREFKWGFDNFRDWVEDNLGPKPSPDHILCRIDSRKHIVPGNLHWSTRKQCANHRRSNAMITIDGQTRSLGEWCSHYGVNPRTAWSRIFDLGYKPKEAFTK